MKSTLVFRLYVGRFSAKSLFTGNDVARLTRIPGIGKKTAERMVLELRDKLSSQPATAITTAAPVSAVEEDVLSALVNLGYPRAAVALGLGLQPGTLTQERKHAVGLEFEQILCVGFLGCFERPSRRPHMTQGERIQLDRLTLRQLRRIFTSDRSVQRHD
jgi:hypothetical protein